MFLIVFVAAVFVWKDCVLNPQPSEAALKNILNIEKEYEDKMKSIKENNKELAGRVERFGNPQSNLDDSRDYFKPLDIVASKSGNENNNPSSKNYNPELVNN